MSLDMKYFVSKIECNHLMCIKEGKAQKFYAFLHLQCNHNRRDVIIGCLKQTQKY